MNGADIDNTEIALPEPRSNRPVTIAHHIEFAFAMVIGAFFRLVGIDASSTIAGAFARTIGPLIGPVNRRAHINLSIIFPGIPKAERDCIIQDAWENLGRTTAEFAHLSALTPTGEKPRVDLVGREVFEKVIKSGAPAVFFSGHFANWEVMAVTMRAVGLNFGVIYRAANNPLIDGVIIRGRASTSSRRQIPKGKRGGRDIIESIAHGSSIVLLADQKLNTGGIAAPLFGKLAMTAPAPARLSIKYGVPLIPLEIERLEGAHFRVTAHDPVIYYRTGNTTDDTQTLTNLINLELERMIRVRPGQWLLFHRRWAKDEYQGMAIIDGPQI